MKQGLAKSLGFQPGKTFAFPTRGMTARQVVAMSNWLVLETSEPSQSGVATSVLLEATGIFELRGAAEPISVRYGILPASYKPGALLIQGGWVGLGSDSDRLGLSNQTSRIVLYFEGGLSTYLFIQPEQIEARGKFIFPRVPVTAR